MQYSKSIILALAPLLASAAPAKRDSTSTLTEFNGFMADLDGDGKLEWHEMEGGRFTTVGPEHAKRYGHISARGQATTPSQWYNSVGNWFGVGLTDGHETEEACITTGNQVLNGLVQAHAASACTAFFSATTAGVAIDNGWNVFQVSGLADMSGANTYINYRWGNLGGSSEIPLTEQLCNSAFEQLLDGPCANQGNTWGGSIEVGGTLGWILGFDPNAA